MCVCVRIKLYIRTETQRFWVNQVFPYILKGKHVKITLHLSEIQWMTILAGDGWRLMKYPERCAGEHFQQPSPRWRFRRNFIFSWPFWHENQTCWCSRYSTSLFNGFRASYTVFRSAHITAQRFVSPEHRSDDSWKRASAHLCRYSTKNKLFPPMIVIYHINKGYTAFLIDLMLF